MTISFFNISDFDKKTINQILLSDKGENTLFGKNIGMIFEKPSTRTRLSFSTAINNLSGNYIDIRLEDLNISRSESFEDTFKAMNCYLDGLIFRTTNHQKLIEAKKYFKKPILNALSDISHPCQALSDLLTLKEQFGTYELNILWMGDMNNVCFSFVEVANLFQELKLTICSPLELSEKINWKIGNNIGIVDNIEKINFENINCVMTDVFISMNDSESTTKLEVLKPYCVNSDLMSKTNEDCVFMHCLPAKMGYEVSEEVFRSKKSIVWRQAYNRMVAQQKLLNFIYQK